MKKPKLRRRYRLKRRQRGRSFRCLCKAIKEIYSAGYIAEIVNAESPFRAYLRAKNL